MIEYRFYLDELKHEDIIEAAELSEAPRKRSVDMKDFLVKTFQENECLRRRVAELEADKDMLNRHISAITARHKVITAQSKAVTAQSDDNDMGDYDDIPPAEGLLD